MADPRLFLVELKVHDGSSESTYYFSNRGFTTTASETPASKHFKPRILQPIVAARNIFRDGGATMGEAKATEGQLILLNGDGALDSIFAAGGIDGRSITVRQGVPGAAYPSGFSTVFRGTMQGTPELTSDQVIITAKGREEELAVPLQTTLYAGDNVLPAGLEGTEELTGKPKPILYGKARNFAPPCVNSSLLIYQVSDGLIDSVDAVKDRGVPMQFGFPMVAADPSNLVTAACVTNNGSIAVAYRPGNGKFYSSTDMVSWTAGQTIATGLATSHVVWADFLSLFIFCGGVNLYTSPDGLTWTQQAAATFVGKTLTRLAVSETSVIAVGISGGVAAIWSSTNATAWTARTTNFSGTVLTTSNCAYGDGRFIVTSGTANVPEAVVSVNDGVTWALTVIPYNTAIAVTSLNADLTYGDGLWLVERNTGLIASSIDGETWALNPGPFSPDPAVTIISEFHYDPDSGIYYAFSQNQTGVGNNVYGWSTDGVTWKQGTTGITGNSGIFQATSFEGRLGLAVVQTTISGVTGGLAITDDVKSYASSADLLDATQTPAEGSFGVFLDATGSYIRLAAQPDGIITCNAREGATDADRTVGQIWKRILTDRAGLVSGTDFSAGDITTLDSAAPGEIGCFYFAPVSISTVLDGVASSVGAWWLPDRTGLYRLKQLVAPSGTAAASFVAANLKTKLTRRASSDPGAGVPCWKVIVFYSKNYTVQTTDLAGRVTAATRVDLAQEWRQVTADDATVQTKHPLAPVLTFYTMLADAGDAQDEADRQLALRKVQRDRFPIAVKATTANSLLDNGDVVSLTHSRFGLSSGKKFTLVGVGPNAGRREVGLELWGGT